MIIMEMEIQEAFLTVTLNNMHYFIHDQHESF